MEDLPQIPVPIPSWIRKGLSGSPSEVDEAFKIIQALAVQQNAQVRYAYKHINTSKCHRGIRKAFIRQWSELLADAMQFIAFKNFAYWWIEYGKSHARPENPHFHPSSFLVKNALDDLKPCLNTGPYMSTLYQESEGPDDA